MKIVKIPSFIFEIILIFLMLITYQIQGIVTSIIPFNEISLLLYLKSLIWLLGLSLLPGLLVLRIFDIMYEISNKEIIVLSISTSLVIVGLVTLLLDYMKKNLSILAPFFLIFLVFLELITFLRRDFRFHIGHLIRINFSFWDFLLVMSLFIIIIIALFIQYIQRYPFMGDIWQSIKAAVEVVSGPHRWMAYQNIFKKEYPVMFGFILGGLSYSSGLPVANTHVFLTPLIALNGLAFYCMLRIVFNTNRRTGVLATIIYIYTGGSAWFIQTLVYQGKFNFFKLGRLTQDIYYSMSLWNFIEFSYKSLALSLGYTSLIAYVISTRLNNIYRKNIMLIICSITILFSFFIHMLEPLIIIPVLIVIAFVSQRGKIFSINSIVLFLYTLFIAYIIDLIMFRYYSWLLIIKIKELWGSNLGKFPIYLFFSLIVITTIVLLKSHISKYRIKSHIPKNKLRKVKYFIIIPITIIYLCGLYFWFNIPLMEKYSPFPWYHFINRYSFIGILAMIGFFMSKWSENWFYIASFWSIFALIFGSFWWGNRLNAYMFPMISLFSSIGINKSLKTLCMKKPIVITIIISTLILSSSTFIYTVNHFIFDYGPYITDDAAITLSWIYNNVPENITLLVPKIWKIYFAINCFSDREIYRYDEIPININSSSFINLTKTLVNYNIKYVVQIDNECSPSIDIIIKNSTKVHHSGDITIFRLPDL